jgi:hypothetical protein
MPLVTCTDMAAHLVVPARGALADAERESGVRAVQSRNTVGITIGRFSR